MISISELERLESLMTKDWEIRPVVGCQFIVDVISPDCEDQVLESVIEDADVKDASGVCAMRNSFKKVLAVLRAALEFEEADKGFVVYGSDYHRDTLALRKDVLLDVLREFHL